MYSSIFYHILKVEINNLVLLYVIYLFYIIYIFMMVLRTPVSSVLFEAEDRPDFKTSVGIL